MEDLLKALTEYGVIAVILAISIMGNVTLVRLLIESYEKRLADMKENKDTAVKLLESIKQTVDTTLSSLNSKEK